MSPTAHGHPWVRSIVGVSFKRGTSQADRQAAVESIKGLVVGGTTLDSKDGEYYVRIQGGGFDDIVAAISILRGLGQVDGAFPVTVD